MLFSPDLVELRSSQTRLEFEPPFTAMYTRHTIKFISNLRQVGSFLWVLRFPPSIKLTTMI